MHKLRIKTKLGSIAKAVLLPGDPLRAKYIADKFFSKKKEVINIAGILGFTGNYQDHRVSVIGTGMGIPSCSYLVYELINFYRADTFIRTGTAGGIDSSLKLNDTVLAMGASTNSHINRYRMNGYNFSAVADFIMLRSAVLAAKAMGINARVGNCFSTDFFFDISTLHSIIHALRNMRTLCVEMEAAGLYGITHEYNVQSLAILQISDFIGIPNRDEILNAEEREKGTAQAAEIALNMLDYLHQVEEQE